MSVLHEQEDTKPIMTLGGFDEKELWAAWRTCCDIPSLYVGHIYVSKLTSRDSDQAIHLAEKPLHWQSREDIENELHRALLDVKTGTIWKTLKV